MKINTFDPFYILLKKVILPDFFRHKFSDKETLFLAENTRKHSNSLWLVSVFAIIAHFGFVLLDSSEILTVIFILLGIATISGSAWFSISFGGVPIKFINSALQVTFWLLFSFELSLVMSVMAIYVVAPTLLVIPLIAVVCGIVLAAIKYDTVDGFKVGLDDYLLKHSRAALVYYKEKEGIDTTE
ncbi:hypothetical protein H6775_01555 [Candidatus Nomurabacteria bacterium]|nr:hypothetical protein [Candidatus Nomurabacteria bacterium]